MIKGMNLIMSSFVMLFMSSAFAQSYKSDNNPLYGPVPTNPLSIAKRLSYENYRSIKLLNNAILNYGGGEAEVDKLIDQYAEASALYFQNRVDESAEVFKKNQIDIMNAAKQLSVKYRDDTTALLLDSTKMATRIRVKMQLRGGGSSDRFPFEKYLEYAQFAVVKANDYHERFKDAKAVSALELINAIYYYRTAKDNLIQMIRIMEMDKTKKDELLAKYKKDIDDNKNKVYESKEKDK